MRAMNMDKQLQRVNQTRQRITNRRVNGKFPRFPLLILVVIVGTIVGANSITKLMHPESQESTTNIQYSSGYIDKIYKSLEELTTSPEVDVIAKGEIIAAHPYKIHAMGESGYTYPKTNFTFQVHWTIKGAPTLEVLQVHQLGGPNGEHTSMLLEDPLMQVGDVLILFLHDTKQDPLFSSVYGDSYYYVKGASQGRFVVQKGRVFVLGESSTLTDERVRKEVTMFTKYLETGGIREEEFRQQLQAILNSH